MREIVSGKLLESGDHRLAVTLNKLPDDQLCTLPCGYERS